MAIDREIESVIQKHVQNAVSEVSRLFQARVAGAIGIGSAKGRAARRGRARGASAPKVAKVRKAGGGITCIAPNCEKISKGPRFHFLCESHRSAPKAKWTKWKATRAAAKRRA